MEPDARLVAALREPLIRAIAAIGGYENPNTERGGWWDERCARVAPAILPAFLADPRVVEWLAERLMGCCPTCEDMAGHRDRHDEAAAILGTEP
jgi:hypothetical protein